MQGVPGNAALNSRNMLQREFTPSAIDQIYLAQNATIAAATGVTLDLTTGLLNPLNESISGADAFAKVLELWVIHEAASLSATIVVGNAGANPFPGLLTSPTATLTLPRGSYICMGRLDATGMAVSGSAKNLLITNSDATLIATYSVLVKGVIA
jgi:hypothetical protein